MQKELYSNETEKALLGLLIKKPDLMADVSGALTSNDFYFENNKFLFLAIDDTFKKHGTSDQILIIEQFSLISGISKEDAKNYVIDLAADSGIESNINTYIDIIRENKRQRDVKETLNTTADKMHESDRSAIEIIGSLESELSMISQDSEMSNLSDIDTLTNEFEINIRRTAAEGKNLGVRTGLPLFDSKIGGFRPGQLVIVAARPSVGKTAFSLALAQSIAKNKKVGFFSLEMPNDQIILRMLTNHSRIPASKIERMKFANQEERNSFQAALTQIRKLNLWIDDSPSITVGKLAWKARKLKKEKGLDIIFIDYLQLIQGDEKLIDNRQQAVTLISQGLKALARELEIPVIALSQLSRKSEDKQRKPLMSDIRESGAIEQDADIIAFLHRDDYQKDGDDDGGYAPISNIEVIIAKHRNGSTGSVMMQLDRQHGAIKETTNKEPIRS